MFWGYLICPACSAESQAPCSETESYKRRDSFTIYFTADMEVIIPMLSTKLESTDLVLLFLPRQENHHLPPFLGIFSFMMFSTEACRQPCTYNSKLTENVTQNWQKNSKHNEAENTFKPINRWTEMNNLKCKEKHNKWHISNHTELQLNHQK